jgi:hypothetical protein
MAQYIIGTPVAVQLEPYAAAAAEEEEAEEEEAEALLPSLPPGCSRGASGIRFLQGRK